MFMKKYKTDDWGEIKLFKFKSSDFWPIMDELMDEFIKNKFEKGFYCNRQYLLDSLIKGVMYGLCVKETDNMYARRANMDEIFCESKNLPSHNVMYMLPCFAIVENGTCNILWVGERARRMGFGTKLVKLLNIKSIYNPLQESMDFWEVMKVKMIKPKIQGTK